MTPKYYAVRSGAIPGIYRSWDECKKQVTGYKGAEYKSFKTEEEANTYMNYNIVMKQRVQESGKDALIAYVDGCYHSGTSFGSGCVLLYQNTIVEKISKKFIDEELSIMRNVAGEIKAAELAITFALENKYDTIIIYHDYEGIAKWAKGEWKTNKEGTKAYKDFIDQVSSKILIDFVKVKAHSGDEYNDMADILAKNAVGLN